MQYLEHDLELGLFTLAVHHTIGGRRPSVLLALRTKRTR
jgi:hypothetical protein